MPKDTTRFEFYEVDPTTDGDMTFNIKTMMNDNWDKIESQGAKLTDIPTKLSQFLNDLGFIAAGGAPVQSVNGKTGTISLSASDVGAEPTISIKNTAFNQSFETSSSNIKMNGAVSVGTSANIPRADHAHPTDTSRAPIVSPTFTGTPAAPTATSGTNTTQLATTAFVQAAIAALVGSSPTLLNTLQEINAAINNDPNLYNDIMIAINNALSTSESYTNGLTGALSSLGTSAKATLVAAINEVLGDITTHKATTTTGAHVDKNINITDANSHFTSATLDGALDELFNNANNGKSSVATAIGSPTVATETFAQITADINSRKATLATNLTNKGQTSSASDTLSNLVAKVANIARGQGVAVESQVRNGVTFSNSDGTLRTGSLAVQSTTAVTIVPGASDIVKPAGIYDAAITVKGTTPEALGGYSIGAIPENEQQIITELTQTHPYMTRLAGNPVIDSAGNVYMACYSPSWIFKYDINANLIWSYQLSLTSGNYIVNLAIDKNDNLLIGTSANVYRLAKGVDPTVQQPLWLFNVSFAPTVYTYVYDGSRELMLMINNSNNYVLCVLLTGTQVFQANLGAGSLTGYGTIEYSPSAHCIYTPSSAGGFDKVPINSSGTISSTRCFTGGSTIFNVHSLAVDSAGNIYCASTQSETQCTIYKVNASGSIIMTIIVVAYMINNIIVDANDNVYIIAHILTAQNSTNFIDSVIKYSSSGVKLWEHRLLSDQVMHFIADELGCVYVKDTGEGYSPTSSVFKIYSNQKILA